MHATIDHAPVNKLDATLIGDLSRFVTEVRDDGDVRVVVLQSANPEFFLAHVDFNYMEHPEEFAALAELVPGDGTLTPVQSLALAIRDLPQVTIAKLHGRLRGGGNELAMAADLRYAAAGETWLSQIESRLGISPGGGGSTLLTQLVGRARALEALLGGDLYDAHTAERYGWINLAIEPDKLDELADKLARRIAKRRPEQIAAAKAVIAPTSTEELAAGFARAPGTRNHLLGSELPRGCRPPRRGRWRTDTRRRARPRRRPRAGGSDELTGRYRYRSDLLVGACPSDGPRRVGIVISGWTDPASAPIRGAAGIGTARGGSSDRSRRTTVTKKFSL